MILNKICSKCNLQYEDYGQRCSFCKPCKRVYEREYHANRSPKKKKAKQDLQQLNCKLKRKFIYEYLSQNSCEICGESDPVVLEFDHINQETKDYCVSEMIHMSLEKIKNEISKCRVLCANCHRRHTAKQLGWYNFNN